MASMRNDGRAAGKMRELHLNYEGLDRVDGSACFAFGETKALASVSGPIEVRLAAELPSKATLEIFVRPLANVPGTESKALGATIRSLIVPSILLSQNPRTLIQLVLQSMTPAAPPISISPSLVASLVNAATLALINAGSIQMRGVVCAVAVGRKRTSEVDPTVLLLDPSENEASSLQGGGYFAFMFASGLGGPNGAGCELVSSNWQASTSFDEEELSRATALARTGAIEVWSALKGTLGTMGLPSAIEPWKETTRNAGQVKAEENSDVEEEDDDKMEI